MIKQGIILVLFIAVLLLFSGYSRTTAMDEYVLVFSEEFDGTVLNTSSWFKQGSTCSPWYSEIPGNVALDGNGNLVLTVTEDVDGNMNGGGVATRCDNKHKGKYDFKYGHVEIRAKLPDTNQIGGIGTSLWLASSSRWPPEIDITETGSSPVDKTDSDGITRSINALKMTIHCNVDDGTSCSGTPQYDEDDVLVGRQITNSTYIHDRLGNPVDLSKDFHIYGLEWTPTYVSWLLDGVEQFRVTTGVPQENMYVILDVAPGGWASGPVQQNIHLPVSAYVDYVKIYQKDT